MREETAFPRSKWSPRPRRRLEYAGRGESKKGGCSDKAGELPETVKEKRIEKLIEGISTN